MLLYSNKEFGPDTDILLKRIANLKTDRLYIDGLNITGLPPLPKSVLHLYAFRTEITSLTNLHEGLLSLYCGHNSLRTLIIPESLLFLDCCCSQLKELDIPQKTKQVHCSESPIKKITFAQSSQLKILVCENTQIKIFPKLPNKLKYFSYSNTLINTLPPLPVSLKQLNCANTQITEIPEGLDKLEYLNCNNTQVAEFPYLPKCFVLICNNRQLILPKKDSEDTYNYLSRLYILICPRKNKENIKAYMFRLKETIKIRQETKRSINRCKIIKSELMANVWSCHSVKQ